MSRFFRSEDSSTSDSESDSALSDDDNPTEEVHRGLSTAKDNTQDTDELSLAPNQEFTGNPRDFLLHALLEERCMNQARASSVGRRFGADSQEVQADARERYLRLCSQLSPLNLISTGLEHDNHSSTRQRFREGLDILDRGGSARSTLPHPLRRLLTDTQAVPGAAAWREQPHSGRPQWPMFPGPLQRLLTDTRMATGAMDRPRSSYFSPSPSRMFNGYQTEMSNHVFESRYVRDFEELSMLGRGGFGVVYHVRHRLDRQAYAVKKIPLSRNRIQRIQQRGQSELDEFLLELQTLARLEHHNIVRYYGGWIEWVDEPSSARLISPDPQDHALAISESARFTVGTLDQETNSPDPHQNHSNDVEIVFEDSRRTSQSRIMYSEEEVTGDAGNRLQRVRTRSTIATVSNDTTESFNRLGEISASLASATKESPFSEPTLALHVQMSLHPMTLANFINPIMSETSESAQPLAHCFHRMPSAQILLAILDGIEYLHNEGIVHRDIKPANIFIGASTNIKSVQGSIDLAGCTECCESDSSNPVAIHVRIGDFGLVTALAQDDEAAFNASAVGTEIYRPLNALSKADPHLDIYALGIIAFELLYKFGTRMERHELIQELKYGGYPSNFAARIGKTKVIQVKECIDSMLSCGSDAIPMKLLRELLFAMQK